MKQHNELIKKTVDALFQKIQSLDIPSLDISDYNKTYLTTYKNNFHFYMFLYSRLLERALKKLKKPVADSTFVDYGGGCGILSYLAKLIGFKTVIYNDLYTVSVTDVQIISKKLSITIDHYIPGDIDELIRETRMIKIHPDLICSFDVLEHIYNIEEWIEKLSGLDGDFNLLFMTSANSRNLFIRRRLKKLHLKAEYEGFEKSSGWKDVDISTPYLEERKNIIKNGFPDLNDPEIDMLSLKTRGLRKDDIKKVVTAFQETGKVDYQPDHPTNTCDPYTGNWAERLLDLGELKKTIREHGLQVGFHNAFYGYSDHKVLNLVKYVINQIIRLTGSKILFLSPAFILEISRSN